MLERWRVTAICQADWSMRRWTLDFKAKRMGYFNENLFIGLNQSDYQGRKKSKISSGSTVNKSHSRLSSDILALFYNRLCQSSY